jgi:host factor-I protein
MAAEKSPNLQDVFLNHVRKNKIAVTIFLINGVKLQGVISSFDNFCLLLRRDGHVQLVYKHAVSTVMPSAPIRLYDPSQEGQSTAAPTAGTGANAGATPTPPAQE